MFPDLYMLYGPRSLVLRAMYLSRKKKGLNIFGGKKNTRSHPFLKGKHGMIYGGIKFSCEMTCVPHDIKAVSRAWGNFGQQVIVYPLFCSRKLTANPVFKDHSFL